MGIVRGVVLTLMEWHGLCMACAKKLIVREKETNMRRFKKKPIVVEAWKIGSGWVWPQWLKDAVNRGEVRIYTEGAVLETLEGEMVGKTGDYIIQGIHGELYPCKAETFHKTYDRIDTEG